MPYPERLKHELAKLGIKVPKKIFDRKGIGGLVMAIQLEKLSYTYQAETPLAQQALKRRKLYDQRSKVLRLLLDTLGVESLPCYSI